MYYEDMSFRMIIMIYVIILHGWRRSARALGAFTDIALNRSKRRGWLGSDMCESAGRWLEDIYALKNPSGHKMRLENLGMGTIQCQFFARPYEKPPEVSFSPWKKPRSPEEYGQVGDFPWKTTFTSQPTVFALPVCRRFCHLCGGPDDLLGGTLQCLFQPSVRGREMLTVIPWVGYSWVRLRTKATNAQQPNNDPLIPRRFHSYTTNQSLQVLPGEILQVLRSTGTHGDDSCYYYVPIGFATHKCCACFNSKLHLKMMEHDIKWWCPIVSSHRFDSHDLYIHLWGVHEWCIISSRWKAKNHFPADVAEGLAKDLRKLLD